jgi:hypothetical protein
VKSVAEIGMKISACQREYYRYTGVSAELERRGAGSSRPELAWARTSEKKEEEEEQSSEFQSQGLAASFGGSVT